MIVAMAGDIRVLLIKLAGRLHNMRTLGVFPEAKQRRIATETLEIYARSHIASACRRSSGARGPVVQGPAPRPCTARSPVWSTPGGAERTALIEQVTKEARAKLKELGVKAEVEGRPKHLYSIYEKMVIRGKEFNEIFDLVGVRILVDSLREHTAHWGPCTPSGSPSPAASRTTWRCPSPTCTAVAARRSSGRGKPLEIQIRAPRRTAQRSTASPPTGGTRKAAAKEASAEAAWLGQMMDWLKDMADPREFMDSLRIDLYGGQVFVFTPKGDVVNLPAGATPVDFAYAIHTDVGHRTIGAKIGGKLVPLDYELRTGDTVEVLVARARAKGHHRTGSSS